MRDKFYFLRFVVVLLKILAVVVLVGGLVATILGFVAAPSGEGTLQSVLRIAAKIGGIVALVAGFFKFIMVDKKLSGIPAKSGKSVNNQDVEFAILPITEASQ